MADVLLYSGSYPKIYDRLEQTLVSGSVRRIHTTLHGIMKGAQQAHLIPKNPVDDVTPPKFRYQQKQVLTEEQLDIFLKVIREDEVWYEKLGQRTLEPDKNRPLVWTMHCALA